MGLARASMGFLGMFFMAGALLLIFLTLLGGVTNTHPLNIIYFLQARTNTIPGAPAVSRWTFWNICRVDERGKSRCGPSHVDFPFDPPSHRNFNTTVNVPREFIGTRHYFLTSRFIFPFIIIGLFFAVCSFVVGLLSLCTRIGGYMSALLGWAALIFQTLSTTLMTAVYVQGRNKFNHNRQPAKVGAKAFAFMWTAMVCIFLSCMFYGLGGVVGRKDGGYSGRETRRRGFFPAEHEFGSTSRGPEGKTQGGNGKITYS